MSAKEINIGDYVRTKDGNIAKYIGYDGFYIFDNYVLDETKGINNDLLNEIVIKSSPNIIDLIEVGDIITFKNDRDVYRVTCIPNKKCGCKVFYLEFNHLELGYEDIEVSKKDMKESLNSIVTKEQFESMEYKVDKQ